MRNRDLKRVVAGNVTWLARAELNIVLRGNIELGTHHDLDAPSQNRILAECLGIGRLSLAANSDSEQKYNRKPRETA